MLSIKYKNKEIKFSDYFETDRDWYMHGERSTKIFYEENIKPHFNIIDAGAQIGMYTVLFSKLTNGKVFSFEPTDTVELLKKNVIFNDCKNVEIINKALSNKDEIKKDFIIKVHSQNIIEDKIFEYITIDSFVKNNNLKIDLLKIDVDSYDYEVLTGAEYLLSEQAPIVVVELEESLLNMRGFSIKDGVSFMEKLNYKLISNSDHNFIFFKK